MLELYPYIFKRKSYHLFRDNKTKEQYRDNYHITSSEIEEIYNAFKTFTPLIKDIKVEIKVAKNEEATCKRGQEYVVLFYSEKKPNYLQNIGFLGEQLDLYLASKNIGALWFGIGSAKEKEVNGLSFVHMIAICKVPSGSFRKDMFKSKRRETSEIYEGSKYTDIANIVRFAPSSCNLQPWKMVDASKGIEVYRIKRPFLRGIIPLRKIVYQNLIDIGIFMCFIALALENSKIKYELIVSNDDEESKEEEVLACLFKIGEEND